MCCDKDFWISRVEWSLQKVGDTTFLLFYYVLFTSCVAMVQIFSHFGTWNLQRKGTWDLGLFILQCRGKAFKEHSFGGGGTMPCLDLFLNASLSTISQSLSAGIKHT